MLVYCVHRLCVGACFPSTKLHADYLLCQGLGEEKEEKLVINLGQPGPWYFHLLQLNFVSLD